MTTLSMKPHRFELCPCIPSQCGGDPHCGVEGINGICGLKEDDPVHRIVDDEPVEKAEVAA